MNPSILKALNQMERGMASPEGRAQVNTETMAARAERAVELASRNPQQTVQPVGKSHYQRLQDGEFGRLD